jgi:hypothetical protein
MPDKNLTQDSSVPSTACPITAPIISCAIVPTTISERAVDIRNQMDNRLAINARPSHNAAKAQTPVILPSRSGRFRQTCGVGIGYEVAGDGCT